MDRDALPEMVEDLMAYVVPPAGGERSRRADACLNFQPGSYPAFANVSAVRSSVDQLDDLVAVAKEWFAARGRQDFTWFLGPSSTPAAIVELLYARGADFEGASSAMTLDTSLSFDEGDSMSGDGQEAGSGIEVREVTSAAEYLAYRRLLAGDDVTGERTPAQEAEVVASNDAAWAAVSAPESGRRVYLAYLDGEPVSGGGLQLTGPDFAVLTGAATAPSARGQGCYRALIRKRWVQARAAGIAHLAIQASDFSAPILRRMGFVTHAELTILRQRCD